MPTGKLVFGPLVDAEPGLDYETGRARLLLTAEMILRECVGATGELKIGVEDAARLGRLIDLVVRFSRREEWPSLPTRCEACKRVIPPDDHARDCARVAEAVKNMERALSDPHAIRPMTDPIKAGVFHRPPYGGEQGGLIIQASPREPGVFVEGSPGGLTGGSVSQTFEV